VAQPGTICALAWLPNAAVSNDPFEQTAGSNPVPVQNISNTWCWCEVPGGGVFFFSLFVVSDVLGFFAQKEL